MKTIRISWLVIVAIAAGLVGWVVAVLLHRVDQLAPVLPLSSMLTMAVIAIVTLVLGLKVLRWRQSRRGGRTKRRLNPILAARTLVLAQATAYAGSLLFGWHTGVTVDLLPLLALRSNNSSLWLALAMMGGGLVMVAIGMVVERFCRIPPEDGDDDDGHGGRRKRQTNGEGEYA